MDPQQQLEKMIEKRGVVQSVYGGFEIEVSEPAEFPWYGVLNHLLEFGQEVWIGKKEGRICIRSEPKKG